MSVGGTAITGDMSRLPHYLRQMTDKIDPPPQTGDPECFWKWMDEYCYWYHLFWHFSHLNLRRQNSGGMSPRSGSTWRTVVATHWDMDQGDRLCWSQAYGPGTGWCCCLWCRTGPPSAASRCHTSPSTGRQSAETEVTTHTTGRKHEEKRLAWLQEVLTLLITHWITCFQCGRAAIFFFILVAFLGTADYFLFRMKKAFPHTK